MGNQAKGEPAARLALLDAASAGRRLAAFTAMAIAVVLASPIGARGQALPAAGGSPPMASPSSSSDSASPRPSRSSPKASARTANSASAKETKSSDDQGFLWGAGASRNRGPINIKSDMLKLDYKAKSVLFTGHVLALQSGTQLLSETLKVLYGKDFHDIKEIVADGKVKISQGARWATGDHAVLDETVRTVVLTGHPAVHEGEDRIDGTKITVYLDTGHSEVEKAQAVLYPKEAKSADNTDHKIPHDQAP